MTVRLETRRDVDSSIGLEPSTARSQPPKKTTPLAPSPPSALAQQVDKGRLGLFAQKSASARFEGVKSTLTARPERADALIDERLRGRSRIDAAIVRAAVTERGNVGLRRYADAETALRELGRFSPDEREDIWGIMKAGASFTRALADEDRALAAEAKRAPGAGRALASPTELRERAIVSVRAEAKEMSELGRKVGSLVRQIGSSARAAELVAGTGSAAGLLGSSSWKSTKAVATWSTKPLHELVEGAGDAGEMMVAGATGKGGRSGRIAEADRTVRGFIEASDRYSSAQTRFEQAARRGDYPTMTSSKREMDAAAGEMRARAKQLEAQVQGISKWDANLAKGGLAAGSAAFGVATAAQPDAVKDVAIDQVFAIAMDELADPATRPLTRP